MNKKELLTEVSIKLSKSNAEVEAVYDEIERVILEQLKKNDKVVISGFGVFSVQFKDGKEATNSFTGEKMYVSARNEPKFKFSKTFKARLDENI